MLPIIIGLSRCLIGDSVRYNATGKYSKVCCSTLAKTFQLHPICPEVESGLSVPREPFELVKYPEMLKAQGRDDSSVDVAHQLHAFFDQEVPAFSSLSGFVLTSRSPSCGLNTVEIKSPEGQILSKRGNGLFVGSLIKHFPSLPLIEEPDLAETRKLSSFQLQVIFYYLIKQGKLFSKELIENKAYAIFLAKAQSSQSRRNQMETLNEQLDMMNDKQVNHFLTILKENLNDK